MPTPRRAALVLVLALTTAACDTQIMPPTPSAAGSSVSSGSGPDGSALPTPSASGDVLAVPGSHPPTPPPAASVTVTDGMVGIAALVTHFDTLAIIAPAGEGFTLVVPAPNEGEVHRFTLTPVGGGAPVWSGERLVGVEIGRYAIPELAAGSYQLRCDEHPGEVLELIAR